MNDGPPDLIAIDHDTYAARHIGRTAEGYQFFLTTPFVPAKPPREGSEFIALYLFNTEGKLLEAKIDDLGPRAQLDDDRHQQVREQRLRELGEVEFGRIEVQPFTVARFGVAFGLVPRPPDTETDDWAVEAMPGNYMAFFPPWDIGEYDT